LSDVNCTTVDVRVTAWIAGTNVSGDIDYGSCSNHTATANDTVNTNSVADTRVLTSRDNMAAVDCRHQHCDDVMPNVGILPLLRPATDVAARVASPSPWDVCYYRCHLPFVAYAWQLMWAREALRVAKNVQPHSGVTAATVSAEDDMRLEKVRSPRRFHPYLLDQ